MKNVENIYPLSPMQQGLLFHALLAPQSEAYLAQWVFTLQGDLQVPALKEAWRTIIARYDVLRTSFVWEDLEEPLQVVRKQVELPWVDFEWSQLGPTEQARELDRFVRQDRESGFDLAAAPLLRLTLIHFGGGEYRLVCLVHHLLLDGWSAAKLFGEVFALYESISQGAELQLEPARPYGDYIAWLQKKQTEPAEQFWRQTLKGFTAPTDLRISINPKGEREETAEQSAQLSLESTTSVQAFARRHKLTVNTVVQGAWALLLSRYSGADDVVFGGVGSGRPADLPGADSMVGLFVNTLPVRAKLTPRDRVVDWLQTLQQQQVEQRQYEYSSLMSVQQWSELPPGTALFDNIFVFQNYPPSSSYKSERRTLQVSWANTLQRTNYPITVTAGGSERLTLRVSYDRCRVADDVIDRMLAHFKRLLEELIVDDKRQLREVSMLSEDERHQIVFGWNDTSIPYPSGQSIPELFYEQAVSTPEAAAVTFGDTELTYRELNDRSNRLANFLRARGVGPEECVAIAVERSVEMIVGLLGILKSGAAYLPVDPANPADRIAFMLKNAGVRLLLTQAALIEKLPSQEFQTVALDRDWDEIAVESKENLRVESTPENLAYVLYTSGSTGEPKGVCVSHRSVIRLVKGNRHTRMDAAQVFLQFAPLAFDASTLEIWGSLLNGARLAVMPPGLPSLSELGEAIRENGVTTLWLTAGLFHQLSETRLEDLRGVQQLLAGGDVLSVPHVERVARELSGTELINGYGPTENTTFTCCYRVKPREEFANSVPIGSPISNTTVVILDTNFEPVPIGVAGELYTGGDGLARGYLSDASLTAERFVPNPFSGVGSRLYRTGDVARYLPDGNVEYLGRNDHQVKLRGYRIEPGEIETELSQYPEIARSVAVVREDVPGDRRLVAYVVAADDASLNAVELRLRLQDKLPAYMVPSAIIELAELPLTANGKVDRRALPAPDASRPDLEAGFVQPRTPTEEIVASIWAEVLKLDRVGVYDNFFELGGHSLLATQTVSRIRHAFGFELPLRRLFDAPTVVALAERIEKESQSEVTGSEPPITRASRTEPLPLSFSQQRMWFLDQLEGENNSYNILWARRLRGPLNHPALEKALAAITLRHDALRTRFVEVDGQPVQIIGDEPSVDFRSEDFSELSSEERERAVRDLARTGAGERFDLSKGPLLRVWLAKLDETEHVLLISTHHIVSDGWSSGIFLRELTALYQSLAKDMQPSLPELPIQYADYAVWQRRWLTGDVLSQQTEYWKKQLSGAPALLELPTDKPRPAVQTFKGDYYRTRLSPELTDSLRRVSSQQSSTLFMTLMAAFQTLLHRYTNQKTIVVGTPIANRHRHETEDLIGFFVNTLALRTDIDGASPFTDVLARVREAGLGAYAHQDLPFERLVEELQPERSLSHMPVIQVLFALTNVPGSSLKMADVDLEEFSFEPGTAKLDLSVYARETPAGLSLAFEYSTDLFEADTIRRLATHFQTLLEGVVANPDQPVANLPLLPKDELELLLEWNNTRTPYTRAVISKAFEAQVARVPNSIALVSGTRSLTYEELNRKSNRLAHSLVKRGVKAESLVGLFLGRSEAMIVAILAVLKAGGAYVPFDNVSPRERLAFMLQDAGVRLLLTEQNLIADLPASDADVVLIDDEKQFASESDEDPEAQVASENLAYVIYTSGSTGKPKGVAVTQGSVLNLIQALVPKFSFNESDAWTLSHSYAFDFSVWEIFGPLLSGGRLVIVPRETAQSPGDFLNLLRNEKVSVLGLTPSALRQLVNLNEHVNSSLRLIVCGGEALPRDLISELLHWNVPLWNFFGPTEATVWASVKEVTQADAIHKFAPLGATIANTQIFMLDPHSQILPVGVAGELCIGGDALARGYFNRCPLTAEKFVPHPFAAKAGARLYRTGDLARYLPNGTIEFIGRIDHQVKLRGFRIELGEIEAALTQHPQVKQGAVLLWEDERRQELVGYVVPNETAPTVTELRNHLLRVVPEYMVPPNFVMLDSLPLNSSGKIDRLALPAPGRDRPNLESSFVAPRTEVEKELADIWSSVLDRDTIGVVDNFFQLGGHSLLATQLVSRIRSRMQVELPLRRLFEFPTIEGLAQSILTVSQSQRVAPIKRVSRRSTDNLPVSVDNLTAEEVDAMLASVTRRQISDQ